MIKYFCDFCEKVIHDNEDMFRVSSQSVKLINNPSKKDYFVLYDETYCYNDLECNFNICLMCAINLRSRKKLD